MADELKTDEERSEELKAWWRDNGTSVAVGIGIAIAGVFGWQQWQQYEINQADTASSLYQQANIDTDKSKKVELLNAVVDDYDATPYAALAALASAAETSQTDVTATIASLKTAVDAKDSNVSNIASLRLVRTYIAEGQLSEAEALLDNKLATAYDSLVEELKGDLFVAKKDFGNARNAYDKAITSAGNASVRYLQMKRDNLGNGA